MQLVIEKLKDPRIFASVLTAVIVLTAVLGVTYGVPSGEVKKGNYIAKCHKGVEN